MASNRLTYEQFDALLTRLGFTRERVESKWLRYRMRRQTWSSSSRQNRRANWYESAMRSRRDAISWRRRS
jgi:hypothetical protein